jgi:CCR4-NOT transcriptional regulation complex NOT5 subunit
MDVLEKLTELLTNKVFFHQGKQYIFLSCKKVNSNIMVLTNRETIQVSVERFADFYENVKDNCFSQNQLHSAKEFVPAELPKKENVVFIPEIPRTFQKLNNSFDNLIDAIDDATEENLKFLEAKSKMLTSLAQTAVNMENSRISLVKLFQNK